MTKQNEIKSVLMVIAIVAITLVIAQTLVVLISLPFLLIVGTSTLLACLIVWFFGKLFDEDSEFVEAPLQIAKPVQNPAVAQTIKYSDSAQAVLDALIDPIVIIDREKRLVFTNQAAQTRLNSAKTGIRLETLVRFPPLLEAIDLINTSLEPHEIVWESHIPTHRFERVNLSLFQFRSETLIAITLTDETALRIAEQTRADFLANAGHELRTPLASIRGFIETLQDTAKNDVKAREKFLSIMNVQAERMSRLINDILSLSKIELNEHIQPRENVDLTETFQFCIAAIEPTAKTYASHVEFELPQTPVSAICDSDEIAQVITNLIDNGLKYGFTKSTVKVIVESGIEFEEIMAKEPLNSFSSLWLCMPPILPSKKYLSVRVENQGNGIDKRNMPRLCERFYRIDEASNSKQGTGLGLAIVKHIINRHNGGLKVESELGKGTAFIFVLPQ
jgi:two-component system phosphate regulon sensor histidine kinase PhoR